MKLRTPYCLSSFITHAQYHRLRIFYVKIHVFFPSSASMRSTLKSTFAVDLPRVGWGGDMPSPDLLYTGLLYSRKLWQGFNLAIWQIFRKLPNLKPANNS